MLAGGALNGVIRTFSPLRRPPGSSEHTSRAQHNDEGQQLRASSSICARVRQSPGNGVCAKPIWKGA